MLHPDSGSTPRYIYAYDVVDNGTRLANKRVLITAEPEGTPDGFRVDVDGNLWCGWTEHSRGLSVDNQLDLGRLHCRQAER